MHAFYRIFEIRRGQKRIEKEKQGNIGIFMEQPGMK